MTFTQAVKTCLKKYADFQGRASRSEYWWFFLFNLLAGFALGFFLGLLNSTLLIEETTSVMILASFQLLIFLPILAVKVRRLHDNGRSGWNILWGFTVIGTFFPLLYWYIKKGDASANKYGEASE